MTDAFNSMSPEEQAKYIQRWIYNKNGCEKL